MKSIKSLLVMAIALSFVFCSAAFADNIKERMKQRLPPDCRFKKQRYCW